MQGWEQVAAMALIVIFLFFGFPRIKERIQNAPKASSDDWRTLIIILGLIILFVVLLIKTV